MMIPITRTEAYRIRLRNLIEPEDILQKHGYITRPLTEQELLLKRRCLGCNKALSQFVRKRTKGSTRSIPTNAAEVEITMNAYQALSLNENPPPLPTIKPSVDTSPPLGDLIARHSPTAEPTQEPGFRCKYHPGQVIQKHWSCCCQHVTAKPCGGSNMHIPRLYLPDELSEQYQFHPTPSTPSRGQDVRTAVALDCEMGTAVSGDLELIRVSLIDYFSGEVLVDNFVEPDVPMKHLNTRFSGVSWADIRKAKRLGICLNGKSRAREALWRYVGPETVVVGHGASNDLRALRWIHGVVVDSFVTEFGTMKRKEIEVGNEKAIEADKGSEGESKVANLDDKDLLPSSDGNRLTLAGNATKEKTGKRGPGNLSLKNLVKKRLGREIQMSTKVGHDSLEDAIAARDLIHWIITNPDCE
ncbi:hypothetical protein K504DRAFT_485452 [Pleomassaria siparia CBS 279.74]|uniref:Exonuclease domain-containing protein n=1 Tax=Pleomassaria siparia CBS 279.74 TaxID=1314801 RepID=A0A6G1JTN9_9PLEO|nr:hypothetical protein K504DRAFT_485452 [Pleomassaria siparia CBS 279.74]